jgi:hypothetical protein
MGLPEKSLALAAACRVLMDEGSSQAEAIVRRDYPFIPVKATVRRFNMLKYTRAFMQDGFIDRYSGARLVFPPVLRVLSFALPGAFPYHPNWKTDRTHPAYWELSATLDHLLPVTRGGSADDPKNWVTTSMARNSAKSNWTVEELGWRLVPPGRMSEWDGLVTWFLEYTAKHPAAIVDSTVRNWRQAAEGALAAMAQEGHGEQQCKTADPSAAADRPRE